MDSSEKKQLSEIDICDLFITPAIKDAGWDQLTQIRREVTLTPGPVIVRGNMSARNTKKKKFADYVLQWEAGVPIAIVEAKDNNHTASQGMQQALGYADILQVPSAFSSTGDAFAAHNKVPEVNEDFNESRTFPTTGEKYIQGGKRTGANVSWPPIYTRWAYGG
jgi:type I restriction enzyme R subunit